MNAVLRQLSLVLAVAALYPTLAIAGAPVCLDEHQRTKYFVAPLEPKTNLADDKSLAQFLGEAEVLEGLASFIEERAKVELKAWAIEDLIGKKLCNNDKGNNFFPDTCALKVDTAGTYAEISTNYDALTTVLRKDFQNIPACTLQLYTHSELPYYFQSIYEQSKLGAPLEYLFYSLAAKEAFYKECRLVDGKLNHNCQLVLPVLLYASALDAAIQEKANEQKYLNKKYLLFLNSLQNRLNLLNKDIQDKIEAKVELSSVQMESYLDSFSYLMDVVDSFSQLADGESHTRDSAANAFLLNNDRGIKQLTLATMLVKVGKKNKFEDLTLNLEVIQSIMSTQGYVEAREYTKANLELINITNLLAKNHDCKENSDGNPCSAIEDLKRFSKVSGAIATLAEAKDKEDFEKKLETLSSPIGSWKRRYEGSFTSINAFFGLAYQDAKYDSPAFDSVDNSEMVTFAPIGIQKTWTTGRWAYGGFISLLDVGNLVNSPEALGVDGGVIKSDVESEFDKVFSPGIYLTVSHRVAPITYGIGYSEGPNGYRTFVDAAGSEYEVDKSSAVSIFVAVDLALFPL